MNSEERKKIDEILEYYKDHELLHYNIADIETLRQNKEYISIELILERDKPSNKLTQEEITALFAPIEKELTKTQRRGNARAHIKNNLKYVNDIKGLDNLIAQTNERYNVLVTYVKEKQYIEVL